MRRASVYLAYSATSAHQFDEHVINHIDSFVIDLLIFAADIRAAYSAKQSPSPRQEVLSCHVV